jgi:hypothetical protein
MNATDNESESKVSPFVMKDCALIAIATNKRATTLKEFRDQIETLGHDSLYHHFWANLLLPRFEEREYLNDFAGWVRHSLHDAKLAEQMAVLDPTTFNDLEELRYHLLEYIDDRLDQNEYLQWAHASQRFDFIRSEIVVFDTHKQVATARELAELMPRMSVSSIFYHFIDARRRNEDRADDFRRWLAFFGETYLPLIALLSGIDPYFSSLVELRRQLADTFQAYFAEQTP